MTTRAAISTLKAFGDWLASAPRTPIKLWLAQNDPSTGNKVYASVNGGTNWTAYSGTLPNRQVECIVYQPGSERWRVRRL